jgi:GntR family transcriptional regulator
MPIYRDIARDLAQRIRDGEFPMGGTLPAEHRLAEHYEVTRSTVRHALAELSRSGMLTPRRGAGWAIHSTLQNQTFSELRSFAQWARTKGFEPGGRVLLSERRAAKGREVDGFRLKAPATVLCVTRIRSLDGRDVMLERTTYAPWMVPIIQEIPDDEPSVVQVLEERFGIDISYAEHSLDAVSATSDDARLLDVRRSSALLRVRRTSYARDGRVVEMGDDRYLPGTVAFQVQASTSSNSISRMTAEGT